MSARLVSRKMAATEKQFTFIRPSTIQLAFDVEDPTAIPPMIGTVKRTLGALHLRTDGENVFPTDEPVKVHQIPESVTDLKDSILWVRENANTDVTYPLATISASSHKLVINANHGFADGGTLFQTFKEVMNPTPNFPKLLPIPLVVEEVFAKELKNAVPVTREWRNPYITHLKVDKPDQADPNDTEGFVQSEVPASSLFCCTNGKVKGLTESLGACAVLSAKAIHDLGDKFGLQASVDLRRFMTPEQKRNVSSVVGCMVLQAPNPRTVGELCDQLRASLEHEVSTGQPFNHWKWLIEVGKETYPFIGLGLYLSNIGQFKIRKPVRDVMIQATGAKTSELLLVLSYSVVSDTQNIVKNQICYGQAMTTRAQAARYSKLTDFALTHLRRNMTIDEALKLLRTQT